MLFSLLNKHKVRQYGDTEDNSIPAEHLEIVLLDKAHQETDDEQRGHERGDCTDTKNHQLGGCKRKAELENLEQACAEHDRNGQEERKLRSHSTRYAEQQRADNRCAGTRGAREHSRDQLKHADHKHGRISKLRECVDARRLALVRVLHQNECYAEHDQCDGNRLVIVEQFFKQVVPLETDDRRRNTSYQNFNPQLYGIHIEYDGRAAVTALSPFKRENLSPEQDNDREYRTELNNHLEHAVKRFRHVQLYKLIEQNHVSGTADRQPLGDALYNINVKLIRLEQSEKSRNLKSVWNFI